MSAYDAFTMYCALKAHFNQRTYDYFKFGGKMKNINPTTLEDRGDWKFFERLARHEDPFGYTVANLVHNRAWYVGEMGPDSDDIYVQWKRRRHSLEYLFTTQLKYFDPVKFKSYFEVKKGAHPEVFYMYMRKEIDLESLVVLSACLCTYSYWNSSLGSDLIWEEIGLLIRKYRPFLEFDKKHYRKLIKEYLKNEV